MESNGNDKKLIQRYIRKCSKSRMTLGEMGQAVGRTKGWASLLVNGQIGQLRFATRNRILEYLGEL